MSQKSPIDLDFDLDAGSSLSLTSDSGEEIPDPDPGPEDPPERPEAAEPIRHVRPVSPDEKVLRWTFRTVPSEHSMRVLLAVCVLSEGETPLRIVNQKDQIMVSEHEGLRVDTVKFEVLTSLFGLG